MNKFKHDILLRIVKSINIVLITIPFAVCWFFYYADHVVSPFYSKENWLVILLFLVFTSLLDAYMTLFLYRYTLSLKSCIHKYFRQCCLTESCMSSFVCCPKASPICSRILAIAGQLLLSVLWARGARRWYFRTFEPQPTAIIYDERRGISRLIEEHGLKNKYDVQYAVSVDECPGKHRYVSQYEHGVFKWYSQP